MVPGQVATAESGQARAADGARIAWLAVGSGEPLLLISGQAVDSSAWDAVVPTFAEQARVITFDHRGTGGTDDAMTPPGNAQLLVAGIPDARLELLPGARHGYYLDDPSTSRVVLGFIREHPMAQT